MPAVDDPFGIAASLPGQMKALRDQVKDLSVNRTQSPAILTVGAGGLTVVGPTVHTGPTTLSGGVTGPVAATGALSGTTVAATGAMTGASVAVTGAATSATVATTGDVNASGRVISAGIVNSPGTKANTVTVGYSSMWIDSSGNMGGNTSSRRYKQDITPVDTDSPGFLGLTTYKFRYIAAVKELGDAAPWESGLIAEEVVLVAPWACFYEDDGTTVKGINYDRLTVGLLNIVKDHEARLKRAGL